MYMYNVIQGCPLGCSSLPYAALRMQLFRQLWLPSIQPYFLVVRCLYIALNCACMQIKGEKSELQLGIEFWSSKFNALTRSHRPSESIGGVISLLSLCCCFNTVTFLNSIFVCLVTRLCGEFTNLTTCVVITLLSYV